MVLTCSLVRWHPANSAVRKVFTFTDYHTPISDFMYLKQLSVFDIATSGNRISWRSLLCQEPSICAWHICLRFAVHPLHRLKDTPLEMKPIYPHNNHAVEILKVGGASPAAKHCLSLMLYNRLCDSTHSRFASSMKSKLTRRLPDNFVLLYQWKC